MRYHPLTASLTVLCLLASASAGTISFSQSNYQFPAGTGIVTLTIVATGGEIIQGTDVIVCMGDGGGDVGGSTTHPPYPIITGLTLTGNAPFIFTGTGNTGDAKNLGPYFSYSGGLVVAQSVTSSGTGAAANRTQVGTLALVTIDMTGVPPGIYQIGLKSDLVDVVTDTITPTGEVVNNTLIGATIGVPEPTALTLLLVGGLLLRRKHRAA
jgi:hypothetical protein